MKKILLIVFLFSYSLSFAQQGSSIIFDISPYNIRSFHTFKIDGTGFKLIYMQQGLIYTGPGVTGGDVYTLANDRATWIQTPFLNSLCCADQNICYPIDYINVAQTDASIKVFNGIFECSSPPSHGDYSKITYNNGVNVISLPFYGADSLQQCRGFDISKENSQNMYMAHTYHNGVYYDEPRIFKSTNGGVDWFVTDTLQGMKPISHNVVNEAGFLKALTWNQDIVFTSTDQHPAYSLDGGYNFQVRTDLPPFKMIVFDEGDWWIHGIAYDNRIFCNNGTITNNWVPAGNPFNIICIEINPDDHTIWYAGSDNSGVWRSTNSGVTFHQYNNSFTPSKKVIGISKDAGSGDTIIVATDKRVYKVWESVLVNTGHEGNFILENFSLSQNYPNPFNPNTIINYSIPTTQYSILKIYDALGNEVATLVNEKKIPGSHSVEWNASNYPSGIYFYKLTAGNFSETKRMILLK